MYTYVTGMILRTMKRRAWRPVGLHHILRMDIIVSCLQVGKESMYWASRDTCSFDNIGQRLCRYRGKRTYPIYVRIPFGTANQYLPIWYRLVAVDFSHIRIDFESGRSLQTIARQYDISQRSLTPVMESTRAFNFVKAPALTTSSSLPIPWPTYARSYAQFIYQHIANHAKTISSVFQAILWA